MTRALLLLLGVVSLFSTSCFRTSTLVKVKKDGTGSIISQYHFSPQTLAMIKQLESLGGALEGTGSAAGAGTPQFGLIGKMATPDEESLRKDAANYGEGVRYAKHAAGKDDDGWEGYSVTYDFDDIRKVRIDQNTMPGQAKEFVESSGEKMPTDAGGALTFDLNGDVLTARTSFAKTGLDGLIDEKQLKQGQQMGMTPSQSMKMAAGMTQGMRAGIFLEADGGIAETTATHVQGDRITLSDADVGKLLNDPDLGAFADKAAADPENVSEESVRELFGKLDGLTIETADEFTVKLK